ncbi:hypothetical protein QW060_26970 [Myroides ceti]|uniref:Uncharacterized protein n=1 Tax=Paenimyroides ceti TaxID=395087 RepID=A0ABT8D1V5_9FLAO|nr:hypothetical protein [Paenimyroides ceti]MDN3710459.1 hypothetical protein [Paenimyroides ceti]
MNWDIRNLSEEDKRKYIVYAIFGIVSIGVIGLVSLLYQEKILQIKK